MAEEANLKAESSAGSRTRSGTTVAKCQDMIRKSLRTPMVKFLLEHMEKEGCSVGDNFIKPVDCDMSISGGYVRGGGVIYYLLPLLGMFWLYEWMDDDDSVSLRSIKIC